MNKTITGMFAALTLLAGMSTALAADADQYAAKTVWVDGSGQSSMADKASKKHAEMAKDGWKFQSLDVYTEDGDMKGLFVTYSREPIPAPAPAPAP
jgi:trehalose-6-phosphate synthase